MVSTTVVVIVGLASFVIGLAIGIWYSSAGKSAEASKAHEVKQEFDDYKAGVNAHFGETAKHFAAIGKEYSALYAHMANSAETLLGADSGISQDSFPKIASTPAVVEPVDSTNDDAPAEDAGEGEDTTQIADDTAAADNEPPPAGAIDDADDNDETADKQPKNAAQPGVPG